MVNRISQTLIGFALLLVAQGGQTQQEQCKYCSAHQNWGDWEQPVKAIAFPFVVVDDATTTFWGSWFGSGYIGFQTLDALDQKRLIFSIWDAQEARISNSDTYCVKFGGEGSGWSCRSDRFRWRPGVRYTARIEIRGDWVRGSIVGGGDTLFLGEIRADNLANLGTSAISFVEQYGYGVTCEDAPVASAVFYPPRGDGRALPPASEFFHYQCPRGYATPRDDGVYLQFGGVTPHNPPPANDNPPPTNDNPPPTNNNPPPTDTGFGGGGGGGGGGSLVSDASLRGLTLRTSVGGESFDETPALAPDFDADTLEYAASVPFSTTHARLTPRTVNPDATVRIGPRGGESAELSVLEPSAVFALAIGENVFEIEVTAEDEETAETYAVTVTRAPPPLSGLTLRASDDGESFDETLTLTPAFDPSATEYAAAALFSMTHAWLTPELGQEDASVRVGPRDGERSDAAGGEPGPALELAFGENVFEIVVTAAGGTAATYTVTVTRPAPPVSLDRTATRQHLFPLLADGDGFRVRLFLTNVSAYPRNACTLELRGSGLDASRFEEHPALTVSDGELEIDSGPTGASVALATGGAGELAFGYARLACAEPAAARLLLARESGGVPAALANQESARAARLHRFPLLSRLGRPGLALANDGDAAAACAVEVKTAAGESAGGGNLAVPAGAASFRFVDEIVSMENGEETDGGAVTVTCDRPVAALGVPLTAAGVFTALAGAVPETDETTEEAEAVPARRVLPLVLDGAGFRSRLEATNRSDAENDNGCALEFHGAGVNTARFPSSADVVKDGFRRATFELPRDGRVAMTSFGRHSYAYGYAVLDCEGPVEAHSLLTAGDGDEADGMAPIPPAQFAREVRFPVAPGLDRMALFLTNAEETDAVCEASLTPAGGEETAAAASIEVGAESTALRFLADLFALPDDFAGGAAALSCDREIAAVALPATAAAAFAALPPVAQGFRDDAQETEEEGN